MVKEPAYVEAIGRIGALPLEMGGPEFGAYIEVDRQKMRGFVKRSGAKVE